MQNQVLYERCAACNKKFHLGKEVVRRPSGELAHKECLPLSERVFYEFGSRVRWFREKRGDTE